jgi:uncharacterized membrane protein
MWFQKQLFSSSHLPNQAQPPTAAGREKVGTKEDQLFHMLEKQKFVEGLWNPTGKAV